VSAPADRLSTIRQDIWNLPNVLSMGRIALIPVVCWLALLDRPYAAIGAVTLFGIAGFTDWLDGYIARRRSLVSMTGQFLDPVADKLLVMAVLVTLVAENRLPIWFVIVMLAREMSVTGLRALAAGEGLVIAAGWGGKWKVGFQFVGLACLLIRFPYTVDYGLFTLDVDFNRVGFALMLVSLGYSLGSGIQYFRGFVHAVADKKIQSAAT
jgi:CDP-diacylglycerol--glycerol-3-phosphate 3-phosphatidyltransferase